MIKQIVIFSLASGIIISNPLKVRAQVGEELLLPAAALCPETIVTCTIVGVVVVGEVTHYVVDHGGTRYVKNSAGRILHNSQSILQGISSGLHRFQRHSGGGRRRTRPRTRIRNRRDSVSSGGDDFIVTNDREYAQRVCDQKAARLSRPGVVFRGRIVRGKVNRTLGYYCYLEVGR